MVLHAARHGGGSCCSKGLHPGAQSWACDHVCAVVNEGEHAVSMTGAPFVAWDAFVIGLGGALPGVLGSLQKLCVFWEGLGKAVHCITVAHIPVRASLRTEEAPRSWKNKVRLKAETPVSESPSAQTPCATLPEEKTQRSGAADMHIDSRVSLRMNLIL